jgi:hypothetical protein
MKRWICFFSAALILSVSAGAQQTSDPAAPPAQPAAATPSSTAPDTSTQGVSATANPAIEQPATRTPASLDQVVDRIIEREHALIKFLQGRTPAVETYLQNLKGDAKYGTVPVQDHYFLGRLDISAKVERRDYLQLQEFWGGDLSRPFRFRYEPLGFSWMIFADRTNFDRSHYDFQYLRREFLGDVRCLVFLVTPKTHAGMGSFEGRIWVEDENYNIVRLNGT